MTNRTENLKIKKNYDIRDSPFYWKMDSKSFFVTARVLNARYSDCYFSLPKRVSRRGKAKKELD
jgi:hypothetical protein